MMGMAVVLLSALLLDCSWHLITIFFGMKDDVVVLDDAFGVSVRHQQFLGLKASILSWFIRDNLVGDGKVCVLLSNASVGEKRNLIAGSIFDHREVAEHVSKVFSFSLAE